MTYFRAVDPFPLESADQNKLAEFYTCLAEGRLVTTTCAGCGVTAWPPRGFCPECIGDTFTWTELPREGVVHACSAQDTGLPAGFDGPRVFAIVKVGAHRIFSIVRDAAPDTVRIGQRVRLAPMRVADDPRGGARWLPAFRPVATPPSEEA